MTEKRAIFSMQQPNVDRFAKYQLARAKEKNTRGKKTGAELNIFSDVPTD